MKRQQAQQDQYKVTTLKVATSKLCAYDFVDEKGESDGYEVAVLHISTKRGLQG